MHTDITKRKSKGALLDKQTEKRLLSYALTATAGLLASAPSMEASIIYTNAGDQTIFIDGGTIDIDFRNSGTPDFRLSVSSGSNFTSSYYGQSYFYSWKTDWVSGLGNPGNNAAGASGYMYALDAGFLVDGQNMVKPGILATRSNYGSGGNWLSQSQKFLALQFLFNGTTYYGWARISVDAGLNVTLHDYAYEDTGAPIVTGELPAATPEPGSLGLLALGSIGLAAFRKRRKVE